MKIDSSGIQRLLGAYKQERIVSHKQKQTSGNADQVQFSASAQMFSFAFKAALDSPDISADRVNIIKTLYDAGKYQVNASEVADSIISHALGKK